MVAIFHLLPFAHPLPYSNSFLLNSLSSSSLLSSPFSFSPSPSARRRNHTPNLSTVFSRRAVHTCWEITDCNLAPERDHRPTPRLSSIHLPIPPTEPFLGPPLSRPSTTRKPKLRSKPQSTCLALAGHPLPLSLSLRLWLACSAAVACPLSWPPYRRTHPTYLPSPHPHRTAPHRTAYRTKRPPSHPESCQWPGDDARTHARTHTHSPAHHTILALSISSLQHCVP